MKQQAKRGWINLILDRIFSIGFDIESFFIPIGEIIVVLAKKR